MAKEKEIPINTKVKVDAKEAGDSIEEFGDKVEKLRRTSQRAAKGSTKDWGGFASLFTGLLPRNVQMMIRKFQSTTRQVGRLSKSLKFLKGAFAGLGIGLLIIALETLIDRWDDIKRLLSGVTQEQEEYNKRIEDAARAVRDYNIANQAYIRIAQENIYTVEEQKEAIANLARSITELKGINTETAEGQALFDEAIKRHMEMVREQSLQQDLLNKLKEVENENSDEAIRLRAQLFDSQVRMNRLDAERTAELERQAEAARLAAEAEREAERQRQLAIKNAEYRASVMETLERDEILRSKDARDRARLELLYDWNDAKEKLENAQATHEEIEALAVYYDHRMKDLERGFAEEDARIRQEASQLFRVEEENEFAEREAKLAEDYFRYQEQYKDHVDILLSLDRWYASEKEKIDDARRDAETRDRIKGIEEEGQARIAQLRAAEDISNQLMRLSEEGTNAQKAFAVTSVLLSQAQAVQSAITGALKAAEATNAAAPFTAPLFIAQMVGIALSSFAQVRSILQQAGASTGGAVQRGGGRGGQTQALVPQGTGGRQQQLPQVNQSYVVQSQLQGQMWLQSSLEKRLHL